MGGVCTAEDCERLVYARGLCGRHYKQVQRHGCTAERVGPRPCAVESCDRQAVTRGWCHGHYLRWARTGDLREGVPLQPARRVDCTVEQCPRPRHSRGLCRTHLERVRSTGTADADRPIKVVTGQGSISHGYRKVVVPADLLHLTGGERNVLEHRLVMAQLLGRPLTTAEVVHHRNGDRLDNRPGNLELWSVAQPRGQRVQDKLRFAYEILAAYDHEAAQLLGLHAEEIGGVDTSGTTSPLTLSE